MTTIRDLVDEAQRTGWTRQKLADAIGVSSHTLDAWLKEGGPSARQAPSWAGPALKAVITGRPCSLVQGRLLVTYEVDWQI